MDGYSVTEAASVLGVPTERVWELLARGVLSGVPDGETGMRVFLQPRPAPRAVDEPRRSNGNARETDAEASPFRELLTEFRGLTERYGQALLALGEARGEVASLRSRVDVLEARMDLRLPFAAPPGTTSSEPRPRVSDHPEADVDGEHEGERSARRKRGRAHFSDEFADALARAEDPSPAVLREAVRAAAPAAAVQPDHDEAIAVADVADAGLPRELPPAETMADLEPEAAPAIAESDQPITPDAESEAEPQPEAELDLEAAAELATEPQPPSLPQPGLEVAAELATEAQPEPEPESAPEPAAESGTELQPEPDAYPEATAALDPELEPAIEPAAVEASPAEADIEPEPVPAAEVAAEAEPEPELEAGAPVESPEPEPAAAGAQEAEAEMEPQPEAEPEPVAADVEAEPSPTPDAVTEAEPEPEAYRESAEEDEPSLAAEFDELPDTELEPEPEPLVAAALEPAAVDEQEPEAEPEPAASDAADASAPEVQPPIDSEPSWDQERYSAQIEEPDWWTPEESVWAQPEVASEPASADSAPEEPATARDDDETAVPSDAVAAPSPAEDEPVSAEVHEERPSVDAAVHAAPPVAGSEEVAIVGSGDSYAGEETMLWFGSQPAGSASDDAPSDDAAGEMEVASTGRRGWVTPEDGSGGMPGARELDAALAGLDSPRGRPAPATTEPNDSPTVTVPPPERPSTPATTSDAPSVVSAELRVHASRAYRRLRRIFPS